MDSSVRILLVDDHQIVLDGIAELLRTSETKYQIAVAHSGKEALEILTLNEKPQVVITDLDMDVMSGRDLCRIIKERYSNIEVIILSMHNEKGIIKDLLKNGASGYLTKSCGRTELNAAIDAVLRKKKYYSTDVMESLLREESPVQDVHVLLKHLSSREIEILKLTGKGWSSKEIGGELSISHRTVESHRNNIQKKLDLNNVAGLIRVAVNSGLID